MFVYVPLNAIIIISCDSHQNVEWKPWSVMVVMVVVLVVVVVWYMILCDISS